MASDQPLQATAKSAPRLNAKPLGDMTSKPER